jgi:alcohol dehydrogenase class IV
MSVPSLVTFQIPSTILFGAGASRELPNQVKRLRARHALIVTDPFFAQNGLADEFSALLQKHDLAATIFAGVQPDPTDLNVRAGLRVFHDSGADIVVGLGGGSSIDAAKAIAMLTSNAEPMRQYMGYHKVPNAGAPMIAIPTTAGTGSEATRVAVISDTERQEKMMMLDAHLMPVVALVDYELSMSMPRPLTAHVGVDTLTHGIEAYVSRKANAMTDPIALSCIRLAAQYLITAWGEPDNRAAREAMALAACQGGMAFSNSSVCLVHGMSRPIGALYHTPHGLSNAVLLPTVTWFSLPGALERYATVARAMNCARADDSDDAAAHKLVDALEALNARLEVPRLRDCAHVSREQFERSLEKMANDALASGSPQNNPVAPTADQIVELYRLAW